jgi:MFS transporter, ACS family, tartrate transporter
VPDHATVELSEVGQRARRRIAWRLMPFLFLLYIVAFLDRVNVAYAALGMSENLGFGPEVFGFGAGIFFVGYFLLEIPGALLVEKWSARGWIARILITWGVATFVIGMVRTPHQFYWARFFLGMAEAGFFPGIIVYLTHWFRAEDRAKAVAMFMAAIPIANIIGAPLAGVILGVHWMGLPGWRWIFYLEGLPAVVCGVVTIFYLTDRPQQARWLPADERDWIVAELDREKREKKSRRHFTVWEALRNPAVLALALIYFLAVTGGYGISFWLPTILKQLSGMSNLAVSLISGAPYILLLITMIVFGWSSDRRRERRWHTAVALLVSGCALAASVPLRSNLIAAVAVLTVAAGFSWTFAPIFWALPTAILTEGAAAASIGFINSVGNLGGFMGPYAVGYLEKMTGSTAAGVVGLGAVTLLAAVVVLTLRFDKKMPS